MKKLLLASLILIFSFISAQVKFEKGYFITNDGQRHEAFIKNIDWLNNPTEFTYKLDENAPKQTATIKDVKEFQIYGYKKLVRYIGDIDSSSSELSSLSEKKDPENIHKEVFLYELVGGKTNLYSYRDNYVKKYFYSTNDGNIIALIYKQYYFVDTDNSTKIATNNSYKDTLTSLFSDDPKALSLINYCKYYEDDLTKVFSLYNGDGIKKEASGKFNLYLRAGLNFHNLKIENNYLYFTSNYPSKTSFRFGVELEWIMPFNKNKWALIFEPNYYSYKNEENNPKNFYNSSINYYSRFKILKKRLFKNIENLTNNLRYLKKAEICI